MGIRRLNDKGNALLRARTLGSSQRCRAISYIINDLVLVWPQPYDCIIHVPQRSIPRAPNRTFLKVPEMNNTAISTILVLSERLKLL